ncbi:MAG: hypothetical protein FH755_06050 [Methylophaga sp.]|nr:hypothetical protein [Methylophaga sp.]
MTILHTILLGLIQGITEFLPISTSAHYYGPGCHSFLSEMAKSFRHVALCPIGHPSGLP